MEWLTENPVFVTEGNSSPAYLRTANGLNSLPEAAQKTLMWLSQRSTTTAAVMRRMGRAKLHALFSAVGINCANIITRQICAETTKKFGSSRQERRNPEKEHSEEVGIAFNTRLSSLLQHSTRIQPCLYSELLPGHKRSQVRSWLVIIDP